jgi:hypothetical protein
MRSVFGLLTLIVSLPALCQAGKPSERSVDRFEIGGVSRLYALAKLGALTNTTLLVEVGDISFLQNPINLSVERTTVAAIVGKILNEQEAYILRDQGQLLILQSRRVANRVLTLPLGPFSFPGSSISSLHPLLEFSIRLATGCNSQGYGWAGPSMDLGIPPIQLAAATFERIVEKVADAPEASMWIVNAEPSKQGCIKAPTSHWEVGLYGFGRLFSGCEMPFRESVGPIFVVGPKIDQPRTEGAQIFISPESCRARYQEFNDSRTIIKTGRPMSTWTRSPLLGHVPQVSLYSNSDTSCCETIGKSVGAE